SWSLQGKNALVTVGIGLGVVEELAGLGASVYTCTKFDTDLQKSFKTWTAAGWKVEGCLFRKVDAHFQGKLDILINGTVGYNMLKSMIEYTEEEIQTGMSANFESAFHTCQLACPLLKASGNGSIVNVSSLSGTVACWPGALYGGMQDHIRVNCVPPFWTRIPVKFAQHMLSNWEFVADLEDCIPLKRVAETHEITSVIASLCMPASSFTTGETICVDGGLTAHGLYDLYYSKHIIFYINPYVKIKFTTLLLIMIINL
ncbi:hypothetical protein BDL97_04G144300, partial [Sphagnum fallax]